MTLRDLPEFYDCLSTLSTSTKDFSEVADKVLSLVSDHVGDTKEGISLLELKNHTILNYLISVLTLVLRKVEGKDIEEARWRSIENRTVLERIRPLEAKLQYQIDKILRGSTPGDTLSHKPDLADLDSSGDEGEGEDREGIYKAPKISAQHYFEPEPRGKKPKTDGTPRIGRSVLEDLRKEMSSAPDESSYSNAQKQGKQAKDRTAYEEANFMRMSVPKSDKKRPRPTSGLSSIMDFEDQEMFESAEAETRGKKSFGGKKGGKGKGKKFKKRRG